MRSFDVIVIGGGHAGIEAAYAAARMGVQVALITLEIEKIGLMPCNPSIGGLGKGHIVAELAAFGGLMPQLASKTYLQARMLNTSKGPAVQGLRLQIDKYAYMQAAQAAVAQVPNLTVIAGRVDELICRKENEQARITGVRLASGERIESPCTVITTGTFLKGRVHVGLEDHAAGRMGEDAAYGLADSLAQVLGLTLGRLKTGTPPRLKRSSLDFSVMERQSSHELAFLFGWQPVHAREKVACYITHTNAKTHEIIRKNLAKSAMYSGNMCSNGPRYCPSIEDKIGRFADRDAHHVFVEPEGYDHDEVYPAGLSTSLPVEVQEEYIRTIAGFENAIITQPGYSVAYDFVQPTHLHHTLESKNVPGLFCAGQINGTTGYEEAAGQGMLAGINAALKVQGKDAFVLDRQESYIGVMIDDLVTLGADEPYRMFTSRAERRLLLRQDNVFSRLMPYGYRLGLIDQAIYDEFLIEEALIKRSVATIKAAGRESRLYNLFGAIEYAAATRVESHALLVEKLADAEAEVEPLEKALHERVLLSIHAHIKYTGYIERELREVEKARKLQDMRIPDTFVYDTLDGLTVELKQKLARYRPATIAQAQLIPGMTPAAISILLFQVRRASDRRLS